MMPLLTNVMLARTESAAGELMTNGTAPGSILKLSMLEGINFAFFVSTFIALIALVLAFFIKKPQRPVTEREKERVYTRKEVTES